MAPQPWDGEERRSAPIHLIALMDSKAQAMMDRVERIISDHTTDEMQRFTEIQRALEELKRENEQRHAQILSALDEQKHRAEQIEQAFLHDPSGRPDFMGHHQDHSIRKRTGEWWSSVKDKSITKVIEWALVAILAWIGYAVWDSFLKGPPR